MGILPPNTEVEAALPADFFRKQRYVAFSYYPAHGFEYERYFSPAGVTPKEIVRVESSTAIVELVAAGFGASILPEWCVRRDAASARITLRELAPEAINVTWHAFGRAKFIEGDAKILDAVASAIQAAVAPVGLANPNSGVLPLTSKGMSKCQLLANDV